MGMLKEFKEFALRGNVVDMAVGVVIGAAFGKIVSSLVTNVIMPPITSSRKLRPRKSASARSAVKLSLTMLPAARTAPLSLMMQQLQNN